MARPAAHRVGQELLEEGQGGRRLPQPQRCDLSAMDAVSHARVEETYRVSKNPMFIFILSKMSVFLAW